MLTHDSTRVFGPPYLDLTPSPDLSEATLKRRHRASELVQVALDAVEPRAATRRALQSLKGQVALTGCTLFAFGKAARGMAEAALHEVRPRQGLSLIHI